MRSLRLGWWGLACGMAVVAVGQAQESPAQRAGTGLRVERFRTPRAPRVPVGDRIITIVRVDPARYAFRFLTESPDGPRRPLPTWVEDFELTGGINAGMFMPDGRTVGYLMQGGEVRSDRRPRSFDALIAFDPRRANLAPLAVGGPGCPARAGRNPRPAPALGPFAAAYRSVMRSRKLLIDCAGRPRRWANRRIYSAAAFGVDRDGWAVLIHSRTPYRMEILSRMLAVPSLGLRGLVFMEGGPEASMVVREGGVRVREVGSWEDGFNPNDDNREFWDLPNVLGFAPR